MHAAPIVAGLFLLTFASVFLFVVWRIVAKEPLRVMIGLAAVLCVSLALRLVALGQYPDAYHEDELNFLADALRALEAPGIVRLFGFTGRIPTLLIAVFEGVPYELTQNAICIRAYSIVLSLLLCVGVYGVSRRLRAGADMALLAAGLCAVLPWTLLYGRTSQGVSTAWHFTLALWAVTGLISAANRRASIESAVVLLVALYLCLQDYYPARSALLFSLAAVIFMPAWRERYYTVGAVAAAVSLYLAGAIPAFDYSGEGRMFIYAVLVPGSPPNYSAPITAGRVLEILWAYVGPYAAVERMSVPAGMWHPWPVLLAAATALLTRQRWFLIVAFVCALLPQYVGNGPINTNRMVPSGAVIAIAAAVGLSRWRITRYAAWPLLAYVAWWSTTLYFSPEFWTPRAISVYNMMVPWARIRP